MARLADAEIARYAKAAGFSGSALITAVAIALAESGGDPQARGYNKSSSGVVTSIDRGLWQINSHYHAEVSDACAFSPSCSAGAAFRISTRGSNWTPWATYGSGAFRQFTGRATTAANAVGTGPNTAPPVATPATPPAAPSTYLSYIQTAADAQSGTETLRFGATGTTDAAQTSAFWGPFQSLVALIFFGGILYVISRTKAGYVALYYGEVLILLFLFATQARYFRQGLLPLLSKSPQETPPPNPGDMPLAVPVPAFATL